MTSGGCKQENNDKIGVFQGVRKHMSERGESDTQYVCVYVCVLVFFFCFGGDLNPDEMELTNERTPRTKRDG